MARTLVNKIGRFRNSIDAKGNDGTSFAAEEVINFTEVSDAANAFDGSVYTVQSSNSTIVISGQLAFTAGVSGQSVVLQKNGVQYKRESQVGRSGAFYHFSFIISEGEFAKDDTIGIAFSTGRTLLNNTVEHYLNIVEEYGNL